MAEALWYAAMDFANNSFDRNIILVVTDGSLTAAHKLRRLFGISRRVELRFMLLGLQLIV